MGQGRGIGFTIPINTALEVRDRLVKSGGFQRGWLGVTVQPLNRDLAEFMGTPELTGSIVTHVIEGSPADTGGLKTEDIVVRIGDEKVDVEDDKDLNNFRRIVANLEAGKKIPVLLLRNGKEKELTVTIGEQPKIEGPEIETNFGFTGQEITASLRLANRLIDTEGVFVSFVEKDSIASEAGVMYGEVILYINDTRVRNLDTFKKAIESVKPGARFLLKARAGDSLRYHLLIPYGKNIKDVIEKD
jgi:S1-C subfamily serine protease